MEHKIHIRKTANEDIPKLASLMGDLGYPVSRDQMETRLNNIGSHPDYCTLVACLKNKVIGGIKDQKKTFVKDMGFKVAKENEKIIEVLKEKKVENK
ncbi:hypothetical protein [Cytobacillus sp. BC1816]|uniref:hypothetical protein n=1 Tax=Cytobacillus sp. BC1816 TaxID=3440154 RepID=UPI003F51927C